MYIIRKGMKRMKKMLVFLVLSVGLLGSSFVGYAEDETKNPINYDDDQNQFIYAPSSMIRRAIGYGIEANIPREVPEYQEFMDLYSNYGIFKKSLGHYATELSQEDFPTTRSFEGANYLTNTELIDNEWGAIYDLRPLADLTNTKEIWLNLYASVPNLNAFSRLVNVEEIYLETRKDSYYHDVTNGDIALTDISALDNMDNLQRIDIRANSGNMLPISLKAGYRKYEVFDPIVLSKQFDGATIQYSSEDSNFTNTAGLLKWNAIPFETEALNLSWVVEKDDYEFSGTATIPIVWK